MSTYHFTPSMTDAEAFADHAETCGCDIPIATNVDVGGKFCRWLHVATPKPDPNDEENAS